MVLVSMHQPRPMRLLTLALAALLAWSATAQWSTDPASPLVVCNAANNQLYPRAVADADSGFYVVWSDLRANGSLAEIYGQHFDSEGNALWGPNGQLLASQPGRSLNEPAVERLHDGSLVVAYVNSANVGAGDTLTAIRVAPDGTPIWPTPVTVLSGSGPYAKPKCIRSGAGLIIGADRFSTGGVQLQRILPDGSPTGPIAGVPAGSGSGGSTLLPDGVGGGYLTMALGNGAGAPLRTSRVDSTLTVQLANMDLTDANGLFYGFATTTGAGSALTAVWEYSGELKMIRIDTTGTTLWSPSVLPVCAHPAIQTNHAALVHDGALYVSWRDNRTDSLGLFMQRFDLGTGAPQWNPTGVPAIIEGVYIPTSRLVASDSGAVIGIMDMSGPSGYSAMRMRADGTRAWDEAVSFATNNGPFYAERTELSDGNGGVVSFWRSFVGDLYGARIYRNGKLYNDVGIREAAAGSATVAAYPNPAQDAITFDLPASARIVAVELFDASGRRIGIAHTQRTLDIHALNPGLYTARLLTSEGVRTSRFIKQ